MQVDDQIAVEKIVKSSGSSFFWGMKALESKKRRAMFSIYAFCRTVDDIADEINNKKLKQNKLKNWKQKIQNIFEQKVPKTSLDSGIRKTIKFFEEEFYCKFNT